MKKSKLTFALRSTATALIGFMLLCVFQIYIVWKEGDTARRSAAKTWAGTSPSRVAFVETYFAKCETPSMVESDKSKGMDINRSWTMKACAASVAKTDATAIGLPVPEAASLGATLELASDSVGVPAPLRWL